MVQGGMFTVRWRERERKKEREGRRDGGGGREGEGSLFSIHIPHHLEHDTADTPHVHFVSVEAVSQEALWRSIPADGRKEGRRKMRWAFIRVDGPLHFNVLCSENMFNPLCPNFV